jgi:hypothetical protein
MSPFRYPDPDKVPGLPLAEILEVVIVTDIKVVLALEVLDTAGVVEVLGRTDVLDVVEVGAATELLTAAEELGGGAGFPDLGRYLTPVAGHVDVDPTESNRILFSTR